MEMARQTPAEEKPHMHKIALKGLNPVLANRLISSILKIWWTPVRVIMDQKKPTISPPMPSGSSSAYSTMTNRTFSSAWRSGPMTNSERISMTNSTRKGVIIKSKTAGTVFRSFFSSLLPITPATKAGRMLP